MKLVIYSDDMYSSAICEGQKIGPLCDSFNSYLSNLHTWFKERNLIISAQ